MTSPALTGLRRNNAETGRASNVELFFDLVYVLAVTQLSHRLIDDLSIRSVLRAVLLLAMVWVIWVYTAWITNYLDPQRLPIRTMLLVVMLISLVMSAGLPEAFTGRGTWVGWSYGVIQIGRSAFAVWATRRDGLRPVMLRLLAWCIPSGMIAVLGGYATGAVRVTDWCVAVGIDLLGGAIGFPTPGIGRSRTTDWTIEGNHFAERCQAFILIALGESIVVIGEALSDTSPLSHEQVGAFVAAFVGAVLLWWIYFDRSADAAAEIIAASDDPGRLGRSAYHFVHPVMVAGIIGTAAADYLVVISPGRTAGTGVVWLMFGSVALYLAGHALFKAVVWRVASWPRVIAVVVLLVLTVMATHASELVIGVVADLVVLAVAVADLSRVPRPKRSWERR